jgi:uncharacterized membrane protein
MSDHGPNDTQLAHLWEDPSHWRFGLLYYAPADPRVFVPKRGASWASQTLNWARPASWAVAAAAILPVLLVAAFALWATG